jgi:DNA mismatch repair ATPase MutL
MIDCNVHPTKKMVNFYKSGSLFDEMVTWMEKLLQESGTVKYIDSVTRMSQQSFMELQSMYK